MTQCPCSCSALRHHHVPLHLRHHVWGRGARAAHVPLRPLDGVVREQTQPAAGQQRGERDVGQGWGAGMGSWGHGMGLEAWGGVVEAQDGVVGTGWGCRNGMGSVWNRATWLQGRRCGQGGAGRAQCGTGVVAGGHVLPPADLADVLRGALPHPAHGGLLHLHRLHLQRVLQQTHRHLPLGLERGHHGQPLLLEVGPPAPGSPPGPCLR